MRAACSSPGAHYEPDAGLWDLLGGFLEEGEDPLAGLRRELLEETGVEIEPDGFLGTFIDTYGDGPTATYVLNLAWRARIVGGEPAPADDVSELRWFSRRRAAASRRAAPSAGSAPFLARYAQPRLPDRLEGDRGPASRPFG